MFLYNGATVVPYLQATADIGDGTVDCTFTDYQGNPLINQQLSISVVAGSGMITGFPEYVTDSGGRVSFAVAGSGIVSFQVAGAGYSYAYAVANFGVIQSG